jgi:hypothetical protein
MATDILYGGIKTVELFIEGRSGPFDVKTSGNANYPVERLDET